VNSRPGWGTDGALNKGTINCHIRSESGRSVLYSVVPVENDGELQLVSHRGAAMKCSIIDLK
jgi:hypothetical protein